ncbi:winged helix-turn-helix transcriptional regulator [Hyalangium versicolor]|uniref:winged helix-turn-helix transcriptional regulator n=1 Tax=Hyalangium versicolor TaxID=2861190 RepID=UPI00272C4094|nr:helix-turn-helix domain-containing protein [Hyalangium versicolor]
MPSIVKELPPIPAERALKVIGGRWKAVILYYLFEGPKRLSELKRLAPLASQKVLVQQLREMEEHGIVHREVFAQVPPRVEYSATKLGHSLQPIIAALCEWGRRHAAELNAIDQLEPHPRLGNVERPKAAGALSRSSPRAQAPRPR